MNTADQSKADLVGSCNRHQQACQQCAIEPIRAPVNVMEGWDRPVQLSLAKHSDKSNLPIPRFDRFVNLPTDKTSPRGRVEAKKGC
ncbi:unnamed protein product [Protopolystoma xenopodis]|uniref:Uncharacterized protein n=1 Tax=Protopolystoma xenopodis TaxID=117903 RepID=A0A448XP92_9PLAT|nr:unnamed protein product [Protopolystoma xenopodis]